MITRTNKPNVGMIAPDHAKDRVLSVVDILIREREVTAVGTPEIKKLTGGASRLTYLISYSSQAQYVVKISLDSATSASPSSLLREHTVLTSLQASLDYTPTPIAFHEGDSIPELLIMRRSEGHTLCAKRQSQLLLEPHNARKLSENFIDRLAEIHNVDPKGLIANGLGNPEGYVNRRLNFWVNQYNSLHAHGGRAWGDVVEWLFGNIPGKHNPPTVVHNDYRLDNLLVSASDTATITSVLDWELATIGDPLMDLGVSMAYWIEANDPAHWHQVRWQPSHIPGMLRRSELVERYARRTGRPVDGMLFFYILGIFRKSCITRNLCIRNSQNLSPRLKDFKTIDNILHEVASSAIQREIF
ncbi:phosphotransferase family protein [Halopseudomonas bauzanensis]|uniref:phosphotransferase family protein n=1 Tax=Halopseudomonas bauzanensis TaxID=653930 RepID=UPI002557794C|nr:phosphotransferase family protein [Halopseudomonas bauzanensis]